MKGVKPAPLSAHTESVSLQERGTSFQFPGFLADTKCIQAIFIKKKKRDQKAQHPPIKCRLYLFIRKTSCKSEMFSGFGEELGLSLPSHKNIDYSTWILDLKVVMLLA